MVDKKLTPMMEAIQEIKESVQMDKEVIDNADKYHTYDVVQARLIYNTSMNIVKKLEDKLEKERQMFIDAYNSGQQIPPFEFAEQYYDKTFKTEQANVRRH